jgi:hypothetical protein
MIAFDYGNDKILFKIGVSHIDRILLMDGEKVLCVQDGNTLKLYSMEAQIKIY